VLEETRGRATLRMQNPMTTRSTIGGEGKEGELDGGRNHNMTLGYMSVRSFHDNATTFKRTWWMKRRSKSETTVFRTSQAQTTTDQRRYSHDVTTKR
jgi:hypothetical protein